MLSLPPLWPADLGEMTPLDGKKISFWEGNFMLLGPEGSFALPFVQHRKLEGGDPEPHSLPVTS